MEDRSNEGKKSPLDDIINHMTAEWHSYGLPPSAPTQAPAPHSSHVWPHWQGQGQAGQALSQNTSPSSGQVPGTAGPGPGAGPGRPYFMLGGEPSLPVFFQADQPPPGYPVDPQAGKAQEFFNQSLTASSQTEANDLGGTMVDIGGGNFVKVRYSGGHGGTVNPQYLPVNASSTALPPNLENILPHSNANDSNIQHSGLSGNYGLFRDVSSRQQVQPLIRQPHLQMCSSENDSPQHQQRLQQHGPPGLLQPSQTLFNEHLQNQQFQHLYSVTQPQQFQHDLLRAQRQHLEQQQQLQQLRQQQQQAQHQHQDPQLQNQQDTVNQTSKTSSPPYSQNQEQLIQNLIGNWTVPNQSGRYNPFGLAMNESNDPPPSEVIKDVEQSKKNDKSIRRTRIVAEVRPMRPSYSAVLTTPSPVPTPQKPTLPASTINSTNGNNFNATLTNTSNKINSDTLRPKSTSSIGSGKGKSTSSKSNGSITQGGKLKRQHSNGSEEQSSLGNRSGQTSGIPKSSGLSSSSSGDLDEPILDNSPPTSLSRRWVSLDDLESDVSADTSNVFSESGSAPEPSLKDAHSIDKRLPDKARTSVRTTLKHSPTYVSDEAYLNNHKAPCSTGSSKGGNTMGSNSTKRPIHINNNLGTNHGSRWASQQSSNQSSNPSKGEKSTRSSKGIRSGSDERKGFKNDGKSTPGGNSSCGISGRSGRGSMSSMAEKAALLQGKRNQRGSRRKDGITAATLVIRKYGQLALAAIVWFFHLLSDVVGMSLKLSLHLCLVFWENWVVSTASWLQKYLLRIPHLVPEKILHSRAWRLICRCLGKNDPGEQSRNGSKKSSRGTEGRESVIPGGLSHNICMPSTGEEAMKRLLACKGKDPYSILGVTPTCSDDDVKKYYKRQAFLVHPDKNNQPGAEEAFKILVHAFELIGEPEKRADYDRYVAETQQVEQAWSELSDLLSQLHQKMEYAANTIRCTNCGKRHKRIAVPRKPFAARFCAQCKIKHSAKEGDIWAETMVMGFLWHYYACMEGAVYDITDWASCQTNNLRHLKPNSHTVQYRIVLGRQRQQNPRTPSEPDLENFLSSLYNQAGGPGKGATGTADNSASTNVPNRQETVRNRKKGKRNK